MKKIFSLILTVVMVFGISGIANATSLESRAGGTMVYDDDLNIPWLADANLARTSGFDEDGLMLWGTADTWADNLVFGGLDDWRLATVSDMSHLFYSDLSGTAGQSILLSGDPDLVLFSNITTTVFGSTGWYWGEGPYARANIPLRQRRR